MCHMDPCGGVMCHMLGSIWFILGMHGPLGVVSCVGNAWTPGGGVSWAVSAGRCHMVGGGCVCLVLVVLVVQSQSPKRD